MSNSAGLFIAGTVAGWLASRLFSGKGGDPVPDEISLGDIETIPMADEGGKLYRILAKGHVIGEARPLEEGEDEDDAPWSSLIILPSGKVTGVVEANTFPELVRELIRVYPPRSKR